MVLMNNELRIITFYQPRPQRLETDPSTFDNSPARPITL